MFNGEPSEHAQRCGVDQFGVPLNPHAAFELRVFDGFNDAIGCGGGDLEWSGIPDGLVVGGIHPHDAATVGFSNQPS